MFASMRNKKKNRDSPGFTGAPTAKTDQQQQQVGKKKDVMPEALKLPSPLRYYPGTQMPMDGWFHACRWRPHIKPAFQTSYKQYMKRDWTSDEIPLLRRASNC